MNNHTDLENKLFEYIRFLISLINIYTGVMDYLYKAFGNITKWAEEDFKLVERTIKYKSMIEDLNAEFNWDAKIVTSEEANKKESKDED